MEGCCTHHPWPESVLTWSKDTSVSAQRAHGEPWRQTPQAPAPIDSSAFGRFCVYRLISCLSWQLPRVLTLAMCAVPELSSHQPASPPRMCLFSIFQARKAVSPGSSCVLPVWTCRDSTSVWFCLDLMDGGWNISLSNICTIYLTLTWIQLCMALETEGFFFFFSWALSPLCWCCPGVIQFLFSVFPAWTALSPLMWKSKTTPCSSRARWPTTWPGHMSVMPPTASVPALVSWTWTSQVGSTRLRLLSCHLPAQAWLFSIQYPAKTVVWHLLEPHLRR